MASDCSKLSFSESILQAISPSPSATAIITIGEFTISLNKPGQCHIHLQPKKKTANERLKPILPTPPLSLSTLNLFRSPDLAKACPAYFAKRNERWKRAMPRKVNTNLNRLKHSSNKSFITHRLNQLKRGGRCFNCHRKGHLNSSCTDAIKCLLCNAPGHALSLCPLTCNQSSHFPLPNLQRQIEPSSTTKPKPPPIIHLQAPASHPMPLPPNNILVSSDHSLVLHEPETTINVTSFSTGRVHYGPHLPPTGQLQPFGFPTFWIFSAVQGSLLLGKYVNAHDLTIFSIQLVNIPFAKPLLSAFSLMQYLLPSFMLTTTSCALTTLDPTRIGSLPNTTQTTDPYLEPLEPPGFEGQPKFKQPYNLQPTRKSPRLLLKNNGPYISPASKAALLAYGVAPQPSGTRKKKKLNSSKLDMGFMKDSSPITREQARHVISLAGFSFSPDIINKLQQAGVAPLP